MNNKKFQTIFDFGSSRIRAGIFNRNNKVKAFYSESEFSTNQSNLQFKIEKIITNFEKDTNEYIDNINLMIDSPEMLSIGISISKKLDGSKLKKTNVQFLVQEAKQQILKYYMNYKIAHIIIKNYKIDDIDYSHLPGDINCNLISIDIFFICLPIELVLNLTNIFSKSNISINEIICSSYVKSISYKNYLNLTGYVSFIDVGFNKTSIICYFNGEIISLDVLPVGGHHITKDISKILDIDLEESEKIKLSFLQNYKLLNNENIFLEKLQKIIFARTEEILELSSRSIKPKLFTLDKFKIVLTGGGSKILDNQSKKFFSSFNDINFFEEKVEDICQSGFNFGLAINKQEVVVIPKKPTKKGFFEKLFHFFR